MTPDELQSKTISFLRFPLTVGVIFIHFDLIEHPFTYHGVTYGLDRPSWYVFLINFFSEVLPQVAVPLFFIISGYLFFRGAEAFDGTAYRRKLLKRGRTLLVPYVLWNLVAYLFHALYLFLSGAALGEYLVSPLRIFHNANGGSIPYPFDLPMWYVRELMVMVVFSPLVYWLVRRLGGWIVGLLGAAYFVWQPLVTPEGSWGVLLSQAAFFFTWGAWFAIRGENFVGAFRRLPFMPMVYLPVSVADALTRGEACNLYIHQSGVVVGVVAVVALVAWLLERGRVRVSPTLAASSFFVYAFHTSVLFEVSKAVFVLFRLGDGIASMLVLYVATPLLCATLCVAVYLLLKRFAPALCSLLTGGR